MPTLTRCIALLAFFAAAVAGPCSAAAVWGQQASMPRPMDEVGAAAVGGKIHVFGGRTDRGHDNIANHDVFDPRTGVWSKAAPLPLAGSGGASTVLDGQILFAGGECKTPYGPGGTAFDDVTAYDPKTDAWTTLQSLPSDRHAFAAETAGRTAYFAAGAVICGDGYTADLLTLRLH